jgi:hypothetical protein
MKTLLLAIFLCTSCIGLAFAETGWPTKDSNCVRWVVQKRMFLVKEIKVAGYNCAIKLAVSSDSESQSPATSGKAGESATSTTRTTNRKVSVSIPLDRFDSGEPERDEAVTDLLKNKSGKHIQFTTSALNSEQWQALANGTLKRIDGMLDISGRSMPITVSLRYDSTRIFGDVRTAFSRLQIPPPVVAGGAIAKVRDSLRLEFRIARSTVGSLIPN